MNVLRFSDLCAQGKAKGKKVFIRADLNVPQDESGAITEDTRIRASVPAIQMALDNGAAVMVTSHLGRPTEGELKPADSLAPVAQRLGELLGRKTTPRGARFELRGTANTDGRLALRSRKPVSSITVDGEPIHTRREGQTWTATYRQNGRVQVIEVRT